MTRFTQNARDTETSGKHAGMRLAELVDRNWSRNKSAGMALQEGIKLTDRHRDVIACLRRLYFEYGLPGNARTTARALNLRFAAQGWNRYLYRLFAGGPVAQGSRPANLRAPSGATDVSFGTRY